MSTTSMTQSSPSAGRSDAEPRPRALPFFGTSWVERGGAYWARRGAFVLGAAAATAAGGLLMRFALQGLTLGDGDRLIGVLGTVGVGICTALAAGRTWTRLEKSRKERPGRTVVRRSAQAKADEAARRAEESARRNPQTPLMILGFVGWLLAHTVHGCVEAPGETAARRELEQARSRAAAKASPRPKKRPKKR